MLASADFHKSLRLVIDRKLVYSTNNALRIFGKSSDKILAIKMGHWPVDKECKDKTTVM